MAILAFKLKLHSFSEHKVLWVEGTLPEMRKKEMNIHIYISKRNQPFLTSYLEHCPVEKYSPCDIEPKIWVIFAWQSFPIWEAKIRHFQCVFLSLMLMLLQQLRKVWKWLQRALEKAWERTGSHWSLWLSVQRRENRNRSGICKPGGFIHHTYPLWGIPTYSPSHITPDLKGWRRAISRM